MSRNAPLKLQVVVDFNADRNSRSCCITALSHTLRVVATGPMEMRSPCVVKAARKVLQPLNPLTTPPLKDSEIVVFDIGLSTACRPLLKPVMLERRPSSAGTG